MFPEYALYSPSLPGNVLFSVAETIPSSSSQELYNPCTDASIRVSAADVQRGFACMAKTYALYIVVNTITTELCSITYDEKCPSDG